MSVLGPYERPEGMSDKRWIEILEKTNRELRASNEWLVFGMGSWCQRAEDAQRKLREREGSDL